MGTRSFRPLVAPFVVGITLSHVWNWKRQSESMIVTLDYTILFKKTQSKRFLINLINAVAPATGNDSALRNARFDYGSLPNIDPSTD
jgi:hypothetical protein